MNAFHRGLTAAVATLLTASLGAQDLRAQTTFTACRVPDVGAIYMIGVSGAPSACLDETHIQFSWTEGGGSLSEGSVTTTEILDGTIASVDIGADAVTSTQIADGTIAVTDLAFDPTTQTELDGLASDLSTAGALNDTGNPVDWTKLKGVPSGFADGADDTGGTASDVSCTGCVHEADIADGAVTASELNVVWRSSDRSISSTLQNHVFQCGTDERVIAGGAFLAFSSADFYVRGSAPGFNVGPDLNDGWRVQVVNTTGAPQDFTLWVLCALP